MPESRLNTTYHDIEIPCVWLSRWAEIIKEDRNACSHTLKYEDKTVQQCLQY